MVSVGWLFPFYDFRWSPVSKKLLVTRSCLSYQLPLSQVLTFSLTLYMNPQHQILIIVHNRIMDQSKCSSFCQATGPWDSSPAGITHSGGCQMDKIVHLPQIKHVIAMMCCNSLLTCEIKRCLTISLNPKFTHLLHFMSFCENLLDLYFPTFNYLF